MWERPRTERHRSSGAAVGPSRILWVACAGDANSAWRAYYYNTLTGETAWERPAEEALPTAAIRPAASRRRGGAVCHRCWDEAQSAEFFINDATGEPTWEIPHGATLSTDWTECFEGGRDGTRPGGVSRWFNEQTGATQRRDPRES